jgi:hypothetical protein
MMTRKITIMALIAGVVLGVAATEGFNVYRQSQNSQIFQEFQEQARCKTSADAYVKENTTIAEESTDTGVSVMLDKVAYSPARNSCVAEMEKTSYFPHNAIESYSVEDLLSGETLVFEFCNKGCDEMLLKMELIDPVFNYVIHNADKPIELEKEWVALQSKLAPKSAPTSGDKHKWDQFQFDPATGERVQAQKAVPTSKRPQLDPSTGEPIKSAVYPPKSAPTSVTQWDAKGNPIPDSRHPPSGSTPGAPASQHK